MTIGEALKNERRKRGLSIRKMAGDIIDPSSYSKVEKNERNIGSDALVRLIFAHEINITDFFANLEDNYIDTDITYKKKLEKSMRIAFNNRNLPEIKKIHHQIMNLKGNDILKLRSIIATAYLENNINHINKQVIDKVFQQLDKSNSLSNNIQAIRLFANAMPIFTDKQLNHLMNIYVNKIIKSNNLTQIDIRRFAIACINYLRACYERKIPLNKTMLKIEDYILNIADSSFLVYKGLVKLSLAAIRGKNELAQQLKQELIDIGYPQAKKWNF